MLTRLNKVVAKVGRISTIQRSAVCAFSDKPLKEAGSIADIEGLTGKARKEAMVDRVYGQELFDRDALSFFEEGTKENPIPILSMEDERIVGISLPDDAEIRWFTLRAGELAYDPDTANFFALKKVSQADVDAWAAKAEEEYFAKK